jgi:hypothetical protein
MVRVEDAACDDLHAEDVARDLRCHDVAVVAARRADEHVRLLDADLAQGVDVDAAADERRACEIVRQEAEGACVGVEHEYVVALAVEIDGQLGADTAAAHDDDFHIST